VSGKVYLAGAGPGDPGLITVAASEALRRADVVVYDRLVNEQLLELTPDGCERIYAGKLPDRHTLTQDEINVLLIEKAREGKRVVRLKGGDPFVFGRGGEEAMALVEAGVPFEVIPGVTSAVAAAAYAGIPVTHRGVAASVAFVTGHEDPTKDTQDVDWQRLATAVDTLVLMMGVGQLGEIATKLIDAGRPATTPVAVVEWGTLARQRTVTGALGEIADIASTAGITSPALVVVGEVVNLRETLSWFDRRPLFGKKVLVTRTRQQASELSRALADAGAEPVELPTIAIRPRYDDRRLGQAAGALKMGAYHWLIFTSANAVDIFFDFLNTSFSKFLESRPMDARGIRASVAAIGPATARALQTRGIQPDVTPERYTAEGLLDALPEDMTGQRVLVPCAEGASPVLADELRRRNASVDEVTLYATETPTEEESPQLAEGLRRLRAGDIDIATFASSSSVTNLVGLLGAPEALQDVMIACIGPITAQTAEELLGRAPDVVAAEHTIDGLLRALIEHETKAAAGAVL
jgi:uroporphyrinogen III methyltransferase/synthase